MKKLNELLETIKYVLMYGTTRDVIDRIKDDLLLIDTDTKLFILSQIPRSIEFMCEKQPEEFFLEVINFYPDLFIYFANNTTERVRIKAIERDANNFIYIDKPSMMIYLLYLKLTGSEYIL